MAKQLRALLLVVLVSFAGEAFSYRFLKGFHLVRKEDALPVKDASGYTGTPYVACNPPPKAKIDSFSIPGCTALPCPVSSGKTYNLTIAFTPDEAIKDLTSKVTVTLGTATIPFDPPIPDACKDQGLKCPLAPNVMAKFITTLTLPKIPLKDITVVIQWELWDTNKMEQVCIKFSVKVV